MRLRPFPLPGSSRLLWLGLLGLCALALAPLGHAEGGVPALSRLEAGPWKRADAVVHARIDKVNDVRAPGGSLGRQVVHATALEVFKGPLAKEHSFTLVVQGQRPTLDAARPSVPYFQAGRTSHHVLFLGRGAQAHAWQLQTLLDVDGRSGRERLEVVQAVSRWSKLTTEEAKAAQVVKDLLRLLTSGGAWGRTFAARELAWLAEQRPSSFDKKSRRTLRRVAPMGTSRDQRYWTRRAMETLAAGREDGAKGVDEQDPWRRLFLATSDTEGRIKLLTRLLASEGPLYERNAWWAWLRLEPSMRTWYLDALVTQKRKGIGASLRRAYGSEEDAELRERIVRALGHLGSAADVPWLVERMSNERLRRSALLALSRIDAPAARKALRTAREAPWADQDLKTWIDHLLGVEVGGAGAEGGR